MLIAAAILVWLMYGATLCILGYRNNMYQQSKKEWTLAILLLIFLTIFWPINAIMLAEVAGDD